MRRNILNSLFFAVIAIGGTACAPKKIVVTPPVTTAEPVDSARVAMTPDTADANKTAETVAMLTAKNVNYTTLSLSGKARLDIDGKENNVGITIKIKRDEMIWATVTAPIIGEVARVLITPDSVKIMNRLQSVYIKKPFSYLGEYTSKQIDFGVLQAVLSGNLITKLAGPDVKAEQHNGVWVLSGNNQELAYRFLYNTLLRVQETNLNDPEAGQALKVVYGDYQQLNEGIYPSMLTINSMAGNNKINISMNFSAIKGNVPMDFPFTVKPRFKVIN